MLKSKLILLFIVLSLSAKAQLHFEVNTRSAKVDTVFDYFIGTGITDTVFKRFEVKAFTSYERDRGSYYHSYKASVSNKYFKLSHITDTEKEVEISSCNLYYSKDLKGVLIRLGADLSYTDKYLYGAYTSIKYKSFSASAAFNSTFYNLSYSYNPKIQISDKVSLGIIVTGLYVEEKFKWRNGVTATILL